MFSENSAVYRKGSLMQDVNSTPQHSTAKQGPELNFVGMSMHCRRKRHRHKDLLGDRHRREVPIAHSGEGGHAPVEAAKIQVPCGPLDDVVGR